ALTDPVRQTQLRSWRARVPATRETSAWLQLRRGLHGAGIAAERGARDGWRRVAARRLRHVGRTSAVLRESRIPGRSASRRKAVAPREAGRGPDGNRDPAALISGHSGARRRRSIPRDTRRVEA